MVPEYFRLPEEKLTSALHGETEAAKLSEELFAFSAEEAPTRYDFGVADADKAWDAIHYVLDLDRRSGRMGRRRTGLGGRMIWGTSPAPKHLQIQRDWIGYSMPADVEEVARGLRSCDFPSLVAAADLDAAQDELYRHHGEEYAIYWFEQLAALYHEAAARAQADLVVDS